MTPLPADISFAPWLAAQETRAVLAALQQGTAVPLARFVGGCVRNTLIGEPAGDIDLATSLPPEEVIKRAEAAGLRAVGTGLSHGTVTLVANGRPFEVTTLRVDVKTDGRRANVQFTEDWVADAGRRDFTMNAIYADADGRLFDPVAGLPDLAARRVRFIGDAGARIREDYLRILRFFRFHAWYGQGDLDAGGLAACAAQKDGLKRLSAERVQKELLRLLEAPAPQAAIGSMIEQAILPEILPPPFHRDRLGALVEMERAHLGAADALRRLAVLVEMAAPAARTLAERLRLSNEMKTRFIALCAILSSPPMSLDSARARLRFLTYFLGAEEMADRLVLSWLRAPAGQKAEAWLALLAAASAFVRPQFPLSGHEVMALGAEGPRIGQILSAVEAWWAENDFKPGHKEVYAKAAELAWKP